MAINSTCRWCGALLCKGKQRTGLCSSCYATYTDMASEVSHDLLTAVIKKRVYERNKCECGNLKDKRAKRCMQCWEKIRNPMITEVGKRSYKGRRRKDTMTSILPASSGRVRPNESGRAHFFGGQ